MSFNTFVDSFCLFLINNNLRCIVYNLIPTLYSYVCYHFWLVLTR